jgi:hypothetical protein
MNPRELQAHAADTGTGNKGLPELEMYANMSLPADYEITEVLGDIIMAEFVDCSQDGELLMRGGILINNNMTQNTWRVAKVLIHGKGCSDIIKKGVLIMFPNDKGIKAVLPGKKKRPVIFLNEERIFGIVSQKTKVKAK